MEPRFAAAGCCVLWLGLARAVMGGGESVPERGYPPTPFVVDVTKPPYSAKGDGLADDTDALQRAIDDCTGLRKVVYLPDGVYLVSRTLKWSKNVNGRENWGFTSVVGHSREKCIIRLKPGTFTDPNQPRPIMWCGGFGSADWFHNYVENLTFDVGQKNAGATALQFYSNNTGAVRDCRFLAAEGSGVVGLDLGHRDMNGPLLVERCEVVGFSRGIASAGAVNSQTFEQIRLSRQSQFGIDNAGQSLSIRNLSSDNTVPALRTYGAVCLLDAQLNGRGQASGAPAITNYNGGRVFLRDVATTGYSRALADLTTPDFAAAYRVQGKDKPGSAGPRILEYSSAEATHPFTSSAASLRLPVKETPPVVSDPVESWANVDRFGADPSGNRDSADAIQKALDSGASTVFMPGCYALDKTIVVRGKVRRVVGLGGWIDYTKNVSPDITVADGSAPTVSIEQFAPINGGLQISTHRAVVLKSVECSRLMVTAAATGADWFFEDFCTNQLEISGQQVWARQLNIENEGRHLLNDGGHLWILGYKTERGGTLVDTRAHGRTEVFGNFSYTTTAGRLAPMFVTEDASIFTFFSEVCFNGDPYQSLIEERRGGVRKVVKKGEGSTAPYGNLDSAQASP